jgi:hypothetical protein
MLYEMLTGDLPFMAKDAASLMRLHVSGQVQLPRQRREDLEIPEALEAVLLRLLAKDPAERYASMREVEGALRESLPRRSTLTARGQGTQPVVQSTLPSLRPLQRTRLCSRLVLETGVLPRAARAPSVNLWRGAAVLSGLLLIVAGSAPAPGPDRGRDSAAGIGRDSAMKMVPDMEVAWSGSLSCPMRPQWAPAWASLPDREARSAAVGDQPPLQLQRAEPELGEESAARAGSRYRAAVVLRHYGRLREALDVLRDLDLAPLPAAQQQRVVALRVQIAGQMARRYPLRDPFSKR